MSQTIKDKDGEKKIFKILDGDHKSVSLNLDCKLCGVNHSIFIMPNNNNNIQNKNNNSNNKACCAGCNIF